MNRIFEVVNGVPATRFINAQFELHKGNIQAQTPGTKSDLTVSFKKGDEVLVEKQKVEFTLVKSGDATGKGSIWQTTVVNNTNNVAEANNQQIKALRFEVTFTTTKNGTYLAYETAAVNSNQSNEAHQAATGTGGH